MSDKFNALFYPNTQTLVNRFNEQDAQKLAVLERHLTAQTVLGLKANPVKGNFDLEHMQKIHQRVFGELYPWAGQVRDYELFKKRPDGLTSEFARPNEIAVLNERLKEIMRATNNFRDVKPTEFATKIAEVYQIANEMHPFREGNGRTQRLYLDQLAKEAGFKLAYSQVEHAAWNYAASMSGQLSLGSSGDRLPGRLDELNRVFSHISVPRSEMNSYMQGRTSLDRGNQREILRLADLNPKLAAEKSSGLKR